MKERIDRDLYLTGIYFEDLPKNKYYSRIAAVRQINKEELKLNNRVTVFVGENGSGKSTLLEGIAVAMGFNPEGGTKNYSFSTKDSHSDLYEYVVPVRYKKEKFGYFLRAESFYNVATKEEEYGRQSVRGSQRFHSMSHGESFLKLVKGFPDKGFYILDEPEAALSPSRLMQLMCIIHDLEESGSQFLIATHSPIVMSYPGACIYELSDKGIHETEYQNTEHYLITRSFLDNPEKMYKYLFEK